VRRGVLLADYTLLAADRQVSCLGYFGEDSGKTEILVFAQDDPGAPVFLVDAGGFNGSDVLEPDEQAKTAIEFALPVGVVAAYQLVVLLFEAVNLLRCEIVEVLDGCDDGCCADRAGALFQQQHITFVDAGKGYSSCLGKTGFDALAACEYDIDIRFLQDDQMIFSHR